ncbi:MAG TPA: wax ester/triacylglycerol synthase family O-acyltransferase [Acidimicrobiales bacterium]|jgi:WS/DGAT/MGAT family acyltransferase|nr:wax ester/triacylglycerol synthase family O-acyltransferase [Acidimicrobiales bacterium]
MKPLSGMDASFLYMETPSQLAHVVGTLILDPSAGEGFSYERMVDVLTKRMHLLEPFRRRLVTVPFNLGHPVWIEDPDFDLESHIHRVAVRAPGTMRELAEIVADIAATPLDRSRPLWELHLIEGLDDGKVGFVTKMHHAAIDGVTGADLMANLFDLTPDAADPEPPETPWHGEAVPSDLELIARAMQGIASRPRTMVKVLRRTVQSVGSIVARQREASAENRPSPALPFTAPKVKWSGAITPHRSVAFGKAALDDMRHVKSTFGTTVNDVVLAACTQTLRQYLVAHDDLPDAPLVCSVPVSVHGKTEHEGTNQVSTMFVRLPVQIEDPVEQLRSINAETREAKEMQNAIGADLLQDFAQFIPPTLFNRAMRVYSNLNLADRHRPVHNLIVSNVPGPPIPLFTAGAQVVGVYPFGPLLEGAGLNLTVLSNMGHVDFGVIACRELVPDVWDIADGFAEAVLLLKKRADEEAGKPKPIAAKRTSKANTPKVQ